MKTHDHDGYGGEHPRWLPTVHRGYDPVLRRWDVAPPQWLWRCKPPEESAIDKVMGVIGFLILATSAGVVWFWHPWL
jgi:hypothetical protein